jgi:hypothetical protein
MERSTGLPGCLVDFVLEEQLVEADSYHCYVMNTFTSKSLYTSHYRQSLLSELLGVSPSSHC